MMLLQLLTMMIFGDESMSIVFITQCSLMMMVFNYTYICINSLSCIIILQRIIAFRIIEQSQSSGWLHSDDLLM